MTLTDKQLAQRRAAGQSRAKSFTPEHQRAARAAVKRETLVASGQKLHAACVKKYGPNYASLRLANWRASRPTKLQQIVLDWLLATWRSNIITERQVGRYFVDFVIVEGSQRLAVECDGQHWHENNEHVGPDREAYGRERDADLRAAGYRVLHLAESDILSGAAREQLIAFLEGGADDGR